MIHIAFECKQFVCPWLIKNRGLTGQIKPRSGWIKLHMGVDDRYSQVFIDLKEFSSCSSSCIFTTNKQDV